MLLGPEAYYSIKDFNRRLLRRSSEVKSVGKGYPSRIFVEESEYEPSLNEPAGAGVYFYHILVRGLGLALISYLFSYYIEDSDGNFYFDSMADIDAFVDTLEVSPPDGIPSQTQPTQSKPAVPVFTQAERLKELFTNCRNFFIAVILDMKPRFNFEDPFFEICELLLDPAYVRGSQKGASGSKLSLLLRRFPHLKTMCTFSELMSEWHELNVLETGAFGVETESAVKAMSVESFWKKIVSLKTVIGLPKFPKFGICISLRFSLPTAEREFSQLKLIKTEKRNNLDDLTINSLLRVEHWLNRNEAKAHNIQLSEDLLKTVSKVKANTLVDGGNKPTVPASRSV